MTPAITQFQFIVCPKSAHEGIVMSYFITIFARGIYSSANLKIFPSLA